MEKELTLEEKIIQASKEVSDAMIMKIKLSKAETDIQVEKRKNHFILQKAKERLQAIESELLN